jgi:hypothetical protein
VALAGGTRSLIPRVVGWVWSWSTACPAGPDHPK